MKKPKSKVPPVAIFKIVEWFLNFLKRMQRKILPPHVLFVNYTVENIVIQRCIYVVTELGIADLLKDGPKSIDQLAKETQTNADLLYRVMRTLAGEGIFNELTDRRFDTTRIGKALQTGAEDSVLPLIRWVGSEYIFNLWVDLMTTVKNGKSYFENNFGENYFKCLEKHPDDQEAFNQCLVVFSTLSNEFVAAAYDFSSFNTVVDVAGGRGGQLISILNKHPGVKGVLFELPLTIGIVGIEGTFEKAGLADRVELVEGDFFQSVIPGHDAYFMKSILHDWGDEDSIKILTICRKAMRVDSKLLIAELVINETNKPHFSKIIDICMAALNTGRERTPEDYSRLLEKAGLKLNRIVPTSSPYSIVEAVPT